MIHATKFHILTATLAVAIAASGCSRKPGRVHPPSIKAASAGKSAIDLYDKDSDGELSRQELAACPGILWAFAHYDKDSDGQVDADEIATRIRQWQTSRVGLMPFRCRVTLDGSPLAGATLKFVPESFLGQSMKPAAGTSSAQGLVIPVVAAADLPADQQNLRGVQFGLYKIEVSHPGRELPEMYRNPSKLGCEITPDLIMQQPVFELSSRSP